MCKVSAVTRGFELPRCASVLLAATQGMGLYKALFDIGQEQLDEVFGVSGEHWVVKRPLPHAIHGDSGTLCCMLCEDA